VVAPVFISNNALDLSVVATKVEERPGMMDFPNHVLTDRIYVLLEVIVAAARRSEARNE
jgi:hypothetical protein